MRKAEIINLIKEIIAVEMGINSEEISAEDTFASLGIDSIKAIYLLDILEKKLKLSINPYWLWEFPTIEKLSKHLEGQL